MHLPLGLQDALFLASCVCRVRALEQPALLGLGPCLTSLAHTVILSEQVFSISKMLGSGGVPEGIRIWPWPGV